MSTDNASSAARSGDHARSESTRGARVLQVVRFGSAETLEVAEADVIAFPSGLIGMEHLRAFTIAQDSRTEPCRWLQSLDEPSLAFLVVDPHLIEAQYTVSLPPEEAESLALSNAGDAEMWTIITVQPEPSQSTANLLAPVIVNRAAGIGRQVILNGSGYALRHLLTTPAGSAEAEAEAS